MQPSDVTRSMHTCSRSRRDDLHLLGALLAGPPRPPTPSRAGREFCRPEIAAKCISDPGFNGPVLPPSLSLLISVMLQILFGNIPSLTKRSTITGILNDQTSEKCNRVTRGGSYCWGCNDPFSVSLWEEEDAYRCPLRRRH